MGRLCSIPFRASCFVSVGLEETVEFILFFQIDRGKTASAQNLPPFCFSLHPTPMISTLGGGVWVEIDRSEACEKALSYVVWRDLRIFSGISKQAHSCRSGIFNFQNPEGALKINTF